MTDAELAAIEQQAEHRLANLRASLAHINEQMARVGTGTQIRIIGDRVVSELDHPKTVLALVSALREARRLLAKHQWALLDALYEDRRRCPECAGEDPRRSTALDGRGAGHRPGCALAEAIR